MKSEQEQNVWFRPHFFLEMLCVVAMVFVSQPAIAGSGSNNEVPMTVTVASNILEQISKLPAAEKKQVEEAVKVGNKFIPQHFDESAYSFGNDGNEQGYKRWLKNTRPLISMNVKDWANSQADMAEDPQLSLPLEINGQKAITISVCPQIELSAINITNEGFTLTYRSKIIGMWTQINDFIKDQKDEFEGINVSMNRKNKVSHVVSQYLVVAPVSKAMIDMISWKVKNVRVSIGETQEEVNARTIRYKQAIKNAREAEASVCGNTISIHK